MPRALFCRATATPANEDIFPKKLKTVSFLYVMTLQKAAAVQGGDGELGVSGDNRGASPQGSREGCSWPRHGSRSL